MDKAYKILAKEANISNREAKQMLDLGLVQSNGKRVEASKLVPLNTHFTILRPQKPSIIFENDEILAINKPAFVDSYALPKLFGGWSLLHRLDKHTSGVILLIKEQSEFHKKAMNEFRNERVEKDYLCLVSGIIAEEMTIDKPISSTKGHFARSKIDFKNGKRAITRIIPKQILGKKTLVEALPLTGRTHQIRLHLHSIHHAILGDSIYGKLSYKRLMLHAYRIKIFDYEFYAKEGDFWTYLHI